MSLQVMMLRCFQVENPLTICYVSVEILYAKKVNPNNVRKCANLKWDVNCMSTLMHIMRKWLIAPISKNAHNYQQSLFWCQIPLFCSNCKKGANCRSITADKSHPHFSNNFDFVSIQHLQKLDSLLPYSILNGRRRLWKNSVFSLRSRPV